MAKGAANSAQMGKLHSKMAAIMLRVLEDYNRKLDAVAQLDTDALEDDIIAALMEERFEPSPQMLAVIAKFLKDNSIEFEAEEINELSAMEQRLAAKKAARPTFASVTTLPVAGNG